MTFIEVERLGSNMEIFYAHSNPSAINWLFDSTNAVSSLLKSNSNS